MIIPKEVRQKPLEYVILLASLIGGLLSYFLIDNSQVRRWIVYSVGLLYFCWSLCHHYKRGDLHLSIVIEYLLIILIGIIFISGTLF
jgi:hypothetical protein